MYCKVSRLSLQLILPGEEGGGICRFHICKIIINNLSSDYNKHRFYNLELRICPLPCIIKVILAGPGAENPSLTLNYLGDPIWTSSWESVLNLELSRWSFLDLELRNPFLTLYYLGDPIWTSSWEFALNLELSRWSLLDLELRNLSLTCRVDA